MPHLATLTPTAWLEAFADHLEHLARETGRLTRIAAFENGFEDWLKFELAALVQGDPWRFDPWVKGVRGDVGVEYTATLRGGGTKDVDAWASPNRGANSWLFAELKVVFNNKNTGKQLRSWRSDLRALQLIDGRVRGQRVAAVLSVLFAVGFSAEDLSAWTDRVLSEEPTDLQVSWNREVPLAGGGALRILALVDGE
jgi:hypothetical protein